MNLHPVNEDELHALIDDALDPRRKDEVLRYLRDHPEVAARVDAHRRHRDALRARLAPIVEAPLPPELNLRTIVQRRDARRAPRWPMAIAATVLLSIGMAGGWLLQATVHPERTGLAALAEEAESNFRVYAADLERPVELRAADRDRLLRWMSSRLDYQVIAPDLSTSGYRFMGGRLVATPQGAAALLMYDDDHGTRIVVFSRTMLRERDSRMRAVPYDDATGIVWSDHGIGYGVVGRLAADDLHRLADEARRQVRSGLPDRA